MNNSKIFIRKLYQGNLDLLLILFYFSQPLLGSFPLYSWTFPFQFLIYASFSEFLENIICKNC